MATAEGAKENDSGRSKVIAIAGALAATAASMSLLAWGEAELTGGEGSCMLCHGTRLIGGLIPCTNPIHFVNLG